MKGKLFMLLLPFMALASCSNDETVEVNEGVGIGFRVMAGATSRTAPTTTNTISEFKTYGFTAGDSPVLYMNEVVTKMDGVWTYGDLKFWPDDKLDFYSVSPSNVKHTINTTTKQIPGFTVDKEAGKQIDLLYAVNVGTSKETKTVNVNFRHALAQIVFYAKNENTNLEVDINGVKVVNIKSVGTYIYPTETTSPYEYTEGVADYESATRGSWSTRNTAETFTAGITEATNITEKVMLTTADEDEKLTGSLLMIPQGINSWDPEDEDSYESDSYFLVSCKLRDADTDIYLWGSEEEYADVAVPVPTSVVKSWLEGKRYNYTFIFKDGGGYVPPTKDDPKPDKVLVPITFEVTVDDFIDGGEQEVPMS